MGQCLAGTDAICHRMVAALDLAPESKLLRIDVQKLYIDHCVMSNFQAHGRTAVGRVRRRIEPRHVWGVIHEKNKINSIIV